MFQFIDKLKCFYTNADQLRNKMTELQVRIGDVMPHIIGITEVKPKSSAHQYKLAEYSLDDIGDYEMFSNIDKEGRGMILYIHKLLPVSEVKMSTNFSENVFVEIRLNKHDNLLVGLLYRSPSNQDEDFDSKLRELISEASGQGHSHILLMGDFNYPGINWEKWITIGDRTDTKEYRFLECIQDNFLYQHITKPTRWRGDDTPHTLDLIFTNEENMISGLELQSPLGKGDHCVIRFDFECYTKINNSVKRVKCYNKADYDVINAEIRDCDWNAIMDESDDIGCMWEKFKLKIREIENKHVPTRNIKQSVKRKRGFPVDRETLNKIRLKNTLSRKAIRTKDPEVRKQYNRTRNQVKKLTRRLRKEFENDISKRAKSNRKLVWQYIKSKSKTREGIGELYTDQKSKKGKKTDKASDKANILGDFFCNVFVNEPDGEVPTIPERTVKYNMEELMITEEDVLKVLRQLKVDKSPGLDSMHPRFLREVSETIAYPLTRLFNHSVKCQCIPDEWKKAKISAILKKGDKCVAGNYRPVSLTSVVCKVMEKLIRNHIMSFMKRNNFFTNKQYGFISGRSTTLQLLEVMDKWTEALDRGETIDCIYMDYQKAFDTVPHNRLISKLRAYHISDQMINWIHSFLSEREQQVVVN